jgi:hypothetical protein
MHGETKAPEKLDESHPVRSLTRAHPSARLCSMGMVVIPVPRPAPDQEEALGDHLAHRLTMTP